MSDDVIDFSGTAAWEEWPQDESGFTKSEDRKYIAGIMRYLKDNHVSMTLVVDGGDICHRSLLINITDGDLQLDKPLEWGDAIDSFRVFFRDMHQRWNFFLVNSLLDNPFSFSIAMPNELYLLQRRSCNRVNVPRGTRALVKRDNGAMATVFVHELGADGMLMCNDPADGEYATDSIIRDIVVSLPPRGLVGEVSTVRKVLPLIGRGRIVRSFMDKESRRPCYGVSFHYESNYVKETINQVVSEVESDDSSEFVFYPN